MIDPRTRRDFLGLASIAGASALGAASHVGNREIAEALLASGARPSIFSAASRRNRSSSI